MAEKVNYSSTSSFYYIEFIVDGSVNKELMSNFRKVRIENSIINAYPIVNLEFHCDNQVFIDNDIYPHKVITMNLYYCNEDNERILEPLTFDLVIMEMNMELPPKSMNNISNETDFQRRNMMLTCVVKQCFELMNKTVNKMWQEPISVQNIVKELCDSIGISSEHFEPTNANTTIVDQCLIPPMTFRAAIDYLDDTYGIYEGRMFRYVNYNGTLEMWDLKTKFDSMKSNAVYKVHKMPSAPSSQPTGDIFKRAATLAEDYADHYLTYDSVSTLSRSNDAFVKNGYQIVNVFHPSADIVDYQKSYVASYNSSYNNYVFNNISSLITYMYNIKKEGLAANPNWLSEEKNKDWNKVLIIPVSVVTNSSSQIVKVTHDMSLTSTKLVGGPDNQNGPIQLSVVYSKFNH